MTTDSKSDEGKVPPDVREAREEFLRAEERDDKLLVLGLLFFIGVTGAFALTHPEAVSNVSPVLAPVLL